VTDLADSSPPQPLVLYDGECGLCDRTVQFLLKHDSAGHLKYAALQSELGKRVMTAHGLDAEYRDSVLLLDDDRLYKATAAVVRMTRYLDRPWRWMYAGRVVPPLLVDPFYKLVAATRFKIFGRVDACALPPPEIRKRFLA
jgi:predicted DCC family thiol-disulfide oxidoreductase YuxK